MNLESQVVPIYSRFRIIDLYTGKENQGYTYQLSIVERHNHTQTADPQSSNKTATKNVILVLYTSLHNNTDSKERNGNNDGSTAASGISKVPIEQGAHPGTQLENGR